MEHLTPGPWRVEQYPVRTCDGTRTVTTIVGSPDPRYPTQDMTVCTIHSSHADEMAIAALPDLILALEQAVCRVRLDQAEGGTFLSAWLPDAVAALQRARGRATP